MRNDVTDELRDPAGHAKAQAEKLLERLKSFADILYPKDAEEPILHPSVRSSLSEWLAETRSAKALKAVKVKPRNLALLHGYPGCGKTTFAHHFAARLGLPLANIRLESLQSKWVNATGENVGELFDILRKVGKHVVPFFDEIDGIGGTREGASVSSQANALHILLRRIEQFDGVGLAATNRLDILDPALVRRFGMVIEIALPRLEERFAILKRYAEPFLPTDDDLLLLAELTAFASPSLLRQLMEGVKRAVVLSENGIVKRDVATPFATFAGVIGTLPVPLAMKDTPPLWADEGALTQLEAFTWPMKRAA